MVWIIWSSLLMFKCLGNLFENLENPLQNSSLICQSPTKAIWWYFLKTTYTYTACFCIELCQIIVTERILFMLSWSRFMCTPHTPLLCFYEKLAWYHPSISQNKYSIVCVGLSLQLLLKKNRGIGYRKKIYGHMKVHGKKEKKYMDTWRSMKKKRKKKIAMLSKRIYIGREIIQKEFPFHPPQTIHVHILIWLYDLISLWIWFSTLQYMWCHIFYTLPWAPHIAIIRSSMKKRQVKCLGMDIYTMSDLRESNEELSKVHF